MEPSTEKQAERPWHVDDVTNPPAVVAYLGKQLSRITNLSDLDLLEAREQQGKGRRAVLDAIASRRRVLARRYHDDAFLRLRVAREKLDLARREHPLMGEK